MNKLFLCCFLCVFAKNSFGQTIPRKSIEDSVLGWMKVYNFKGAKEPLKVDARLYTVAQLSLCDSFANWIQASYLPKGGWGDIKRYASEKLGLYNQHTAGKPQVYGASAKTYLELKYNSNHKLDLYTSDHIWWDVVANGIPGDWAVRDLCSPGQYYFIMPTAETMLSDENVKKVLDLTKVKSIQPYISLWVGNAGFGGGSENVLLCKDNKLPFVKLTKGEYLQAMEVAIPRFYEKEKKKIQEAEQGDQQRIAVAMKQVDKRIEDFVSGLKKNREKYKNRMEELAMTSTSPGLQNLAFDMDVFSSQKLTDPESTSARYPVYKVDPAIAERCKTSGPQWILVSWDYYIGADNRIEQHQHESIINNFNFDYVYNFFFAPEKVKGQPYRPLILPTHKETVITSVASEAAKKNTTDKNLHFFDDFSTTAIGKSPAGWRSTLSYGVTSVIAKLDGLTGNWAELSNFTITPTQLPKPLPQNFTLSYDLLVLEHFTWGARGLIFQLSKETSPGNAESYLSLKLRPGFDGKDGEATLETKFPSPPGYSNETKWLVAPGFSNNKKYNRITVTIKKSGEMLQVFIDKQKIAEYGKAIPAAHLFNALSFTSGNAGENDKFYISNIRIIKE